MSVNKVILSKEGANDLEKVRKQFHNLTKKNKVRTLITINQESYLCCLAKDATSIALIGFLCWFNHNFIGGSYFVNFLILCLIYLYILHITKIPNSGATNYSSYHGVSKEKIKQIKQILKEQENVSK